MRDTTVRRELEYTGIRIRLALVPVATINVDLALASVLTADLACAVVLAIRIKRDRWVSAENAMARCVGVDATAIRGHATGVGRRAASAAAPLAALDTFDARSADEARAASV